MKAIIKDLEYNVHKVVGAEMWPVKTRYVIGYSANVVIKRDGEFYEVPIRMSEDVAIGDLLEGVNRAHGHFEDHCDKLSANWKINTEEYEDYNGAKIITQRKIELFGDELPPDRTFPKYDDPKIPIHPITGESMAEAQPAEKIAN